MPLPKRVARWICEKAPRRASVVARLFPRIAVGPRPPQLAVEPGTGVRPVADGGGPRQAEGFGRRLDRQAGEVSEGDELGLDRVLSRELGQSLVQSQEVR